MAGEDTSLSGLPGRYALALLALADENRQLDDVAEDLRSLKAMLDESDDLRNFLRSPLYSRDDHVKIITAVLDKAEVQDLTRRFVLVVAQNRRLFALQRMAEAYLRELARRRGEITAEVVSATELNESQHDALVEALRSAVGGKVQVEVTVDRDLIGGLIVKVGSRMVDSSLRSKLQRLQLAMKGVG